jgi:hypothetical protein
MRVTRQTDRYVILDDVLPPEQFELSLPWRLARRVHAARRPPAVPGQAATRRLPAALPRAST